MKATSYTRGYALPTIILTNDDGIQSTGLISLKKRLDELGQVMIIAPRDERSGVGKALTTNTIRITKTRLRDGSEAYAITGTPADAFLLAANKILKRPPDLLVAGINIGPNLGIDDLLNSGTLGAALEAAIHGVPAIAVSYAVRKIVEDLVEKAKVTEEELELTASLGQKAARYVLERGMPPDVDIISINVPEKADSKRIELTSLSYKGYGDIHTKQRGGYKIKEWLLSSYPDDKPDTDLYIIKKKGCISITPIKIRFRHHRKALENLSRALAA